MSTFFLAPALVTLRNEVDAKFPNRDKASDGWIGDSSHAARPSDHNPDWNDPSPYTGIVRAIDVDIDGNQPGLDLRRMLLNTCIGDGRVWYVISNRVIYSRTHNWAALRYTGSNPHDHHVHISLMHHVAEFSTSPWFETLPDKVNPLPIRLDIVAPVFRQFMVDGKQDGPRLHISRVQKALNIRYGMNLSTDGVVGQNTADAWGRHELATEGKWRRRVPDEISLRRLVSPYYYMAKSADDLRVATKKKKEK
jgi:hypothetical protein